MRSKSSIIGTILSVLLLAVLAGIHSVWPTLIPEVVATILGLFLWFVGLAMSFGAWVGGLFQ